MRALRRRTVESVGPSGWPSAMDYPGHYNTQIISAIQSIDLDQVAEVIEVFKECLGPRPEDLHLRQWQDRHSGRAGTMRLGKGCQL